MPFGSPQCCTAFLAMGVGVGEGEGVAVAELVAPWATAASELDGAPQPLSRSNAEPAAAASFTVVEPCCWVARGGTDFLIRAWKSREMWCFLFIYAPILRCRMRIVR